MPDAGVTQTETRLEGDPAAQPQVESVDRVRARLAEALGDRDHLLHREAVQELRRAYERQYPNERPQPQPGELVVESGEAHVAEPTDDAMTAARARAAEMVLSRHMRPAEARQVAGWTAGLGIDAAALEPVLQSYLGRLDDRGELRDWTDAEVFDALGRDAEQIIEAARANLAAIGNPELNAWLDASGLGSSPEVIRLFASL